MNDYALMSMAPAQPSDFPLATPDSAGIPESVRAEMLIAPFNDIDATTAIIERHHDELAGVIVEPFQRVIPPVPGFLKGLREVTRRYEIPLIFDEIVTGYPFRLRRGSGLLPGHPGPVHPGQGRGGRVSPGGGGRQRGDNGPL